MEQRAAERVQPAYCEGVYSKEELRQELGKIREQREERESCPALLQQDAAAREASEAQVETGLLMASLPPHVNMQEAIVLPAEMVYIGRG